MEDNKFSQEDVGKEVAYTGVDTYGKRIIAAVYGDNSVALIRENPDEGEMPQWWYTDMWELAPPPSETETVMVELPRLLAKRLVDGYADHKVMAAEADAVAHAIMCHGPGFLD